MTSAPTDPGPAVARLSRARRVLVTSHASPDGDAIGSELALAELLARLGVKASISNRDPAPTYLAALPGGERIVVSSELPVDFPDDFDLVATVECPDLDRPGLAGLDRLPIVNIDHHRGNPSYGEVNYLDEDSPAVGEMIWRMFRFAGVTPSPEAATNAYVALSTDTGDFRFGNATSRAFRAAAEMVEAGARPAEVASWVHESRSAASVRLLGEALQSLRFDCGGQLASMAIDTAGYRRAGAGPSDSEDLINVPRSIAGVEVVAFFKQWEPGVVRVSLRSRGDIDVRAVAAAYGGGGHTNASGCTVHGDLESVRRDVTTRAAALVGGEP
jgi:bifunctional oligoribonuclease and PAP phosphatase NrnA